MIQRPNKNDNYYNLSCQPVLRPASERVGQGRLSGLRFRSCRFRVFQFWVSGLRFTGYSESWIRLRTHVVAASQKQDLEEDATIMVQFGPPAM